MPRVDSRPSSGLARLTAALASLGLGLAACTSAGPGPAASTPAPTVATPTTATTTTASGASGAPTAATSPTGVPAVAAAIPTPVPAAAGAASQPLIEASLANLSKTLHPYPDSASYTQSWVDASILLWGSGDGIGGLLSFDWDKLEYRPAMATGMPTISPDGQTYTFTLRHDLKWSDGSAITVDDFQFAWDNASKEENGFVGLDQLKDIASYRTSAPDTVQITLTEPKARDVALGTVNLIGPIPKAVWQNKPWNDAAANPEILNPSVVLGPYRVQDFKIAERGTFVAVNSYPGGKPQVPMITILAAQQPTVAYEALRSGRANWAPNIPPEQYQDAKANPDLNMIEWTAANAAYRALEFNTARPFLSDRRVREALARAVSRDDALDIADSGLATPQYSFLTPTNTKWVNSSIEKYDFDLNASKQLLQQAGYTMQGSTLVGSDGQPVKVQVLFPTSSSPRAKLATYLQQQYKQLGIDVEVKGLDFNAFTDQVDTNKDFDIALATYGGGSLDPDLGAKAQLITGGQQNVTGYSNPQVDQLFKQAGTELDDARRKQLYDQIQQIVNADLPSHYLYAIKSFSPVSKKVQGVVAHRGDRLDYNDALLAWSVMQ